MAEPFSMLGRARLAVAGAFAGKLTEAGARWLIEQFKDHEKTVQEAAEKNALVFLNDLAERVKLIESTSKATEERIEKAFDDPDFAVTLRSALIASARTSTEEKHRLLARTIAARITADPEGLVGLTTPLAVQIIPSLNLKHLRLLGVATITYFMTPNTFPPTETPAEGMINWFTTWLKNKLEPMKLEELEPSGLDYSHLMSLSCLKYESLGTANLKQVLMRGVSVPTIDDAFLSGGIGKQLSRLWSDGMKRITLTTVGELIGVYVVDQITGTTTTIDW